ncbi:MAG: trypsin-like serine protease [Rhodobacteraceae bacterium]|nr:trypsin-like serine protease [Paracoccaceae bacterium]
MRMGLSAILVAICAAGSAQAKDSHDGTMTTLVTADETRGWEGVGRLNMGKSGFCTASLISPTFVLTAAHCLFDKTTGAAYDPGSMEFLAGWRNGRAVAYRGIRRAIPHPDYVYEGPDKMDRVAYDLAILELDQPIRLPSIKPFKTDHDPHEGDAVGVVSYALDRSEAPSLQKNCHVLERQTDVLVLSCNVNFGSSGAPIFALDGDEPRIVSVVSAKAEMGDDVVALGTAMEEPLAVLMQEVGKDTAGYRRVKPAVSTLMSTAPVSGGAKFLKP